MALLSFFPSMICCTGEDIWRFVGKLTDAQKSMLDDRFKWKVSSHLFQFPPFLICCITDQAA